MHSTHTKQVLQPHRCMQRKYALSRLVVMSCLFFLSTLTVARAENPAHVQRLLLTRFCRKCNLNKANLVGKNLQGARLTDTKLKRANLRGANLRFAILRNVNLRKADLTDADLTGAILKNVNLRGAILNGAKLPQGSRPQLPSVKPRVQMPN